MCSVEPHTTEMVCVNCISPGYFMGLCFMVLFSLCLPFWVKAPNPVCFQGADLISCLLSKYAYQKKKTPILNLSPLRETSYFLKSTRNPDFGCRPELSEVTGITHSSPAMLPILIRLLNTTVPCLTQL